GTVNLPVRTLLVLVGLVILVAVGVWWFAVPWKMAPGKGAANVAIVEFGVEEGADRVTGSPQGAYLSHFLYNALQDATASSAAPVQATYWHIATSFDPVEMFWKHFTAPPVRNEE